jgi:AcrR family transcriptional regulator
MTSSSRTTGSHRGNSNDPDGDALDTPPAPAWHDKWSFDHLASLVNGVGGVYAQMMQTKVEPRRRNLEQTKTRILAAAADTFTEFGYAQASLREIAMRAEVATSLVSKHFGAKASLFEHALLHVLRTSSVFVWDKADFGTKMSRVIPERATTNVTSMLVLALAHPEAKDVARRVSRTHMIDPLAEWLGPPNADERAMDLFSLLTGFAIQRQGLSAGPISPHSLEWLAGSLQAIVDMR